MALISCENCGKQISDQVLTCPHCGAARMPAAPVPVPGQELQPQQPKGNCNKIAIGIVIAVIAIVIMTLLPTIFRTLMLLFVLSVGA